MLFYSVALGYNEPELNLLKVQLNSFQGNRELLQADAPHCGLSLLHEKEREGLI